MTPWPRGPSKKWPIQFPTRIASILPTAFLLIGFHWRAVVSSGLAGMWLARRSGPTVCELLGKLQIFFGEVHGSWEGGNRLPLVRCGQGGGGSEGLAGTQLLGALLPSPQQTGIDSDPQPPAQLWTAASHRHFGVASVCVAMGPLLDDARRRVGVLSACSAQQSTSWVK